MRSARWTERECAVCALASSSRTTEEAEEEEAAVADTEAVEEEDMGAEEEAVADAEDRVLARALPEDPGWFWLNCICLE